MRVGRMLVVALAVMVAGCTSAPGSRATTVPSSTVPPVPVAQTEARSGSTPGTADGSIPVSTGAPVTLSPSSPPTTPATTIPAGATPSTDPLPAAPPPVTDAAGAPGPPMDGCVDAAAGPVDVEVVFDEHAMRFGGAPVPCVRVHAAQHLVVRNTSLAAAEVLLGGDSQSLKVGQSVRSDAVGTLYAPGDVFDVNVVDLDLSLVVQVLP